jgi:hypothetical protein
MRLTGAALAASAIMLIATLPAKAASVTDDVTFSASGFTSFPTGVTPPTDPVTGSFTITFDPTQTVTDSTGITLNTQNISLDSSLVFDYSPSAYTISTPDGPASFAAGELVVGGSFDGAATVQYGPATNDFTLQISSFTTSPVMTLLLYAQTSDDNTFFYNSVESVSVTPVVSATPVPAALPLFAGGLGVIGLFGRRRKRNNAAAVAAA